MFANLKYASFLLLIGAGCGAKTGDVQGTVTYNGELLRNGTVIFQADANHGSSGAIRPDGQFHATNVPLGKVRVLVRTMGSKAAIDTPPSTPDPQIAAMTPTSPKIPERFGDPATAKLEYTVQPGVQQFHIQLKD